MTIEVNLYDVMNGSSCFAPSETNNCSALKLKAAPRRSVLDTAGALGRCDIDVEGEGDGVTMMNRSASGSHPTLSNLMSGDRGGDGDNDDYGKGDLSEYPDSRGGNDSSTPDDLLTSSVFWSDITVGDILFLRNNEKIPADVVLLTSSEEKSGSGTVYVETANIDGETNLKIRESALGGVPNFSAIPLSEEDRSTARHWFPADVQK